MVIGNVEQFNRLKEYLPVKFRKMSFSSSSQLIYNQIDVTVSLTSRLAF